MNNTMEISAPHSIDRMKRAHCALMANLLEAQNKAFKNKNMKAVNEIGIDLQECERMIAACEERLKGTEYES